MKTGRAIAYTLSLFLLVFASGDNSRAADGIHLTDLIEDKDEPGKWWCFYKQHGVSMSWSFDLTNWTFSGSIASGENVCVPVDKTEG